MTAARRSLLAPALATLVVLLLTLASTPATADPQWASVDDATIHPGVQMYTDGAQCTANFIFYSTDAQTGDVADMYIGYAAHCAGLGSQTDTNGCTTQSLAYGTEVDIAGASQPGTLAYSSWQAMQDANETDANACAGNDFALVLIDPADHDKVNPSIPFWGGPQGINTDGVSLGERIFSYGNSSLRPTDSILSRKEGYAVQTGSGGWLHTVYTTSPGIPGDSGSAYLDGAGRALGVVSTLALPPLALSNTVTALNKALAYAITNGGLDIQLAEGTEVFAPGLGTMLG